MGGKEQRESTRGCTAHRYLLNHFAVLKFLLGIDRTTEVGLLVDRGGLIFQRDCKFSLLGLIVGDLFSMPVANKNCYGMEQEERTCKPEVRGHSDFLFSSRIERVTPLCLEIVDRSVVEPHLQSRSRNLLNRHEELAILLPQS